MIYIITKKRMDKIKDELRKEIHEEVIEDMKKNDYNGLEDLLDNYFYSIRNRAIEDGVKYFVNSHISCTSFGNYFNERIRGDISEVIKNYKESIERYVSSLYTKDYVTNVSEKMIMKVFAEKYADIAQDVSERIARDLFYKIENKENKKK